MNARLLCPKRLALTLSLGLLLPILLLLSLRGLEADAGPPDVRLVVDHAAAASAASGEPGAASGVPDVSSGVPDAASGVDPWTVFRKPPLSENQLCNPGFEDALPGECWAPFSEGYEIDPAGGRGGSQAAKLTNEIITHAHGAIQVIVLNQSTPRPLYFSGWSRAEGVTGIPDIYYSLYLDVYYQGGSALYGQTLRFEPKSCGWQFREGYIHPTEPISYVRVHVLLRDPHTGTAWFDDLEVREVLSETTVFDELPLVPSIPASPPYGDRELVLSTDDGLSLALSKAGGAVTGVWLDDTLVSPPGAAYMGGLMIRDVGQGSDFYHIGGSLAQEGDTIRHRSEITPLNLDISAIYTATADRIAIRAEITDTSVPASDERAVTLYFPLPISATGWSWGDDIRSRRTIAGSQEYGNFYADERDHDQEAHLTEYPWHGLGANGKLSKYPWAVLYGNDQGIVIAIPLDSPRAMRLVHNPATNQFYVAFDLGLSPYTTKFPRRAWVDLILYRVEKDPQEVADWGFRAAAQGYYDRFPTAFTRRIPCSAEGIWVPFTDLCDILGVQDYTVGFHETSDMSHVACDDRVGALTCRYLVEPQTHWLPRNDASVDLYNYDRLMDDLKKDYSLPNLVRNDRFEEGSPGFAHHWAPYREGYTIDAHGGQDNGRALKLTNPTGNATYGALQIITLDQSGREPLYIRARSKALNITGSRDKSYSLYVDLKHTDGTWSSGYVLAFDPRAEDWQTKEDVIYPVKPVAKAYVYCLLRSPHAGTAWFDDVVVREPTLLRNQLTNPGFEDDPPDKGWNWFGSGYEIDPTGGLYNGYAVKLTSTHTEDVHGVWQAILLNQLSPQPIYMSAWSRAQGVTGSRDINYSLYIDIQYTDGSWSYAHALAFDTGTHGWQFLQDVIVPDRPIKAMYVYCLLRNSHTGMVWFDEINVHPLDARSEATLSSGMFDGCGRYRSAGYGPGVIPWCSGLAGCALFRVNPDPAITDLDYAISKARLEWNWFRKQAYATTLGIPGSRYPGLDMEYIDSYLRDATVIDLRTAHFAAADTPLTFRTSDRRVGIAQVFATTEFAHWVAQDVHDELGKWMMANWILRDLPWGADLFDVMGTELGWPPNGDWDKAYHAQFSYYRTLAQQRPYALLLNMDLNDLTYDRVKDYFEFSLFYAVYPGFFSHNAAEDPYWENSALYNRDRPLFKRYIPLIRRLNCAGWEPATQATVDHPGVYIERFGRLPNLYFTLRNTTTETTRVTVTLPAYTRMAPECEPTTACLLVSRVCHPISKSPSADTWAITLSLSPQSTDVLFIPGCQIYYPLVTQAYESK